MNSRMGNISASRNFSGSNLCATTACYMCKKKFGRTSQHAYTRAKHVGGYIHFCSYTCMRAYDRALEETREKRKKAETEHRVSAQRKWRGEKREKEETIKHDGK